MTALRRRGEPKWRPDQLLTYLASSLSAPSALRLIRWWTTSPRCAKTGPAEPMKRKRNACVAYQHEMASNQGFQEAALKLCPHLVVTNQPLRDLRNRKYAGTAAFEEGYQM